MRPEYYDLYEKLMKSFNSRKESARADSIFGLLKIAFEHNKLPKDMMEIKTVIIAQFEWNGQKAAIIRSLVDPKKMLDISYKVFLVRKLKIQYSS